MVNDEKNEILVGRNILKQDVGVDLDEDNIIILNHFSNPYKNNVIYSILVQVLDLTKLPLTIIGNIEGRLGYHLNGLGVKVNIVKEGGSIKEEPRIYLITGYDVKIPKHEMGTLLNKNNIVIISVGEYKEDDLKEEISMRNHTLIHMYTEDTTMRDIIREYKIPIPKLHKTTDAYIKRTGDVFPQRVQLYNIIKKRNTTKRNYEFYPQPLGAFTKLLLETDKESKFNEY